ncbi:MAG: DUF4372 domain-containing protein [Elusimicrobiaceae bacterium]|nr:DUF4372 domain-containing protein [Elusimicrobiaceae bacterium]
MFSGVLSQMPGHQFETLAVTYKADVIYKELSTWNQFTGPLYAQAAKQDSRRDMENSLCALSGKLWHLGLPDKIRTG